MGLKGASKALEDFERNVLAFVTDIQGRITSVSGEMLKEGLGRFGSRSQLAEDILAGLSNRLPSRPKKLPGGTTPTTGKNAVTEESKAIDDALKAFEKRMASIRGMSQLLGADFDALGEEAGALNTVMQALGENGIGATDERMQRFAARFKAVKQEQTLAAFDKDMNTVRQTSMLLGRDFDSLGAEAGLLNEVIGKLLADGMNPADPRLQGYRDRLRDIAQALPLQEFDRSTEAARTMAELMAGDVTQALDPVGTHLAALSDEGTRLTNVMQALAERGLKANDPLMQQYADRLKRIHAITIATTKAQEFQTTVAGALADAIEAAAGGDLGRFAAGKAKQLALEAVEESIRGGLSLLNPFTAGNAGAHFAAAGQLAGLAAGWGALAAGFGGFSGGGSASRSLASSRGASGQGSERSQGREQEIHIHLDGPGFDALNPKVRQVVYGAMQEARAEFGNMKIRLHRGGR